MLWVLVQVRQAQTKKRRKNGRGEIETKKFVRPQRPPPPAYLPHLSREFKKGGHATGREREGKGVGKGQSTQYVKFFILLLNFFGRPPQKRGGRIRSLGRCRHAGPQRLPRTKTGRTSIHATNYHQNHFDNHIQNEVSRVRVSERRPFFSKRSFKMSLRPSTAFVVAFLLCYLGDPRDRQEALAAEGVHPHPGPWPHHGAVKQEVETIKERTKRAEDREKVRGGEKKKATVPIPPFG